MNARSVSNGCLRVALGEEVSRVFVNLRGLTATDWEDLELMVLRLSLSSSHERGHSVLDQALLCLSNGCHETLTRFADVSTKACTGVLWSIRPWLSANVKRMELMYWYTDYNVILSSAGPKLLS